MFLSFSIFTRPSRNTFNNWISIVMTNNRKPTAFLPNFFIVPPVFIILHCIRCNYFQLPFKFSHWFLLLPRKLIEDKFVYFFEHVDLYDWQIIFMKVLVISLIYDSILIMNLMRFDSSSFKVCNFVLTPSIRFLREAYY
jgi:hypothetical protein